MYRPLRSVGSDTQTPNFQIRAPPPAGPRLDCVCVGAGGEGGGGDRKLNFEIILWSFLSCLFFEFIIKPKLNSSIHFFI